MAKMLDVIPFDDTFETLRRFWRWWSGELAATIPASLRARLVAPRTRIEVTIESDRAIVTSFGKDGCAGLGNYATDDANSRRAHDLKKLGESVTQIVARLPADHVLRKRLTFPYASSGHIRALLKHEVVRHSPLDLADVQWTSKVLARDRSRNRSEVELQLVKRDTIERALKACLALGLSPQRVEFGDAGSAVACFHVARQLASHPRAIWRRFGIVLLSAVAIALVALNLAHDYRIRAAQARVLTEDVRRLKPETEAVRRLRDEITAIESGLRATAARKRGATLQSMAEITKLLPDNTWVFDLQSAKDGLTLRGYSEQAANLIGVLDRSKLFREAQFQAPLTKSAQDGKDRFDLAVKFRGVP